MKSRQPEILALFCVLIVLLLIGAWMANNAYRYSVSPERESAFLRNYNVRPVIESFAFKDSLAIASGSSSGAGRKFVTNQRETDPKFAIQPDQRSPLMSALSEDLAAQLVHNGATIVAKSGDPQRGFRFTYRDGTSAGSVALSPIENLDPSLLGRPLPEGTTAVRMHIAISEKWFPEEAAAIRASVEPQ